MQRVVSDKNRLYLILLGILTIPLVNKNEHRLGNSCVELGICGLLFDHKNPQAKGIAKKNRP